MKKLSCLIFAFLGSLLFHIPSVSAGPADDYADSCKWKYKYLACSTCPGWFRCLTRNGRILDNGGSVAGVLNNNYTSYRESPYGYRFSGIYTSKYQQVNHGNTLIEYQCRSDRNGTCTEASRKTLYQYMGE